MSPLILRNMMGAGALALAASASAGQPAVAFDAKGANGAAGDADTQAAPTDAPAAAGGVEEVVVTARRRSESLQDVPASITVLTAKTIRDAGIERVADFTRLMPNVTFESPLNLGQNFLTIRGVTQTVFKPPPAAIVVDGVQIISPLQFNIEQFDVEQIEMLKGPQGAVYGRNAIAGAINTATRKPGREFEAGALLGVGSGRERKARVTASGPLLDDTLAIGAGLSHTERRGQMTNATTGQRLDGYDDVTARLRALYTPSRAVGLDLKYLYSNTKGGDPSYALNPGGDPDHHGGAVVSNVRGDNPRKLREGSAKLDLDGSLGTVSLILAYVDAEEALYSDYDFTSADMFRVRQRQRDQGFSQELRFASPGDGALRWIAGAYHVRKNNQTGQIGLVDPGLFADPAAPTGVADVVFIDNLDYNRLDNRAVFGQLEYQLRPSLELAVALRHDRDRVRQRTRGPDGAPGAARSAEFSRWQPKLTLTSKADRDMVVYGSYGVGFRSGDFNPAAATIGLPISKAESGATYEVGAKTRWFERRLTLNAAAFVTDMKDYQVQLQDFSTGTQVGINLDKVRINGLELEAVARVVPGLNLNAALGLTDAKIKAFGLQPELVGKRPPHLAPYSLNLGFSYERPAAAAMSTYLRGDYRRIGGWKWNIDNAIARKPVNYLDLHAGLRGPDGRWTLSASVNNALDDRTTLDYQTAAVSGLPSGMDVFFPSPGRSFRIELAYAY
jgi:iron complex outermembrane receptor protein